MTDLSRIHRQLDDIERDIRIINADLRRRTEAIAEGVYTLLMRRDPFSQIDTGQQIFGQASALNWWSRWNNARGKRDEEYPAPSGGAAE